MTMRHFVIILLMSYCAAQYACEDDNNHELFAKETSKTYRNLVLEGGGSKAISYVGALKAFKSSDYYHGNRYTFENISGTSAGCLMGLFISLDIDPEKLETEVFKNDIFASIVSFDMNLLSVSDEAVGVHVADEMQKSWFSAFKNTYKLIVKVSKILELWMHKGSPGLSTDHKYRKFLTNIIFPLSPHRDYLDANMTFEQLYQLTRHRLTCYASRLKENSIVRFNVDETPKEYVLKALYASITIPGIFKPVTDNYGYPLVDGGMLNNFPIYDYDYDGVPSSETLGLSLNTPTHGSANKAISPPTEYFEFSKISTYDFALLMHSLINDEDISVYTTDPRNKNRIVYLDSPLQVLNYNIKPSLLTLAINRAYFNTLIFLQQNKNPSNFIQIE